MWPFTRKKKEQPKFRRSYNGADTSRLLADWITMQTSADSEIKGSLSKLRSRSRQLARDNDYMKGFIREVKNNVIGTGISFQAQVKMQRGGKLNATINDQIEAAWKKWTRKEFCDVSGKMSFQDIERLAMGEVVEAGEFYLRMIYRSFGGSKIPFSLELIEAEYLDHDLNKHADAQSNEIKMGVEMDQWGRPVAYHFKSNNSFDGSYVNGLNRSGTLRVPASEIIPLFICERAKQTRGVPWIAATITRLRHMTGYEEAEIVAARASASLMGFIESPEGQLIGDGTYDGDRVTDFEPGVFKYLSPGERVNVPDLKRPGGQFDPFIRLMIRGMAAGTGVSYESLSKDYSQSNYSSSRLSLLSDRDNWRALQGWMVRNFHQIVFEKWLDMAVLSGELSLAGYELQPEKYQAVKWMPRGWAWVDPQKEVTAYKEAVKGGLTTLTEVVAQSGGDIEELLSQRAREIEMADDLGLVFDTDASVTPNGHIVDPNNPTQMNEPQK